MLADWDDAVGRFGKVMPRDYKRVLKASEMAEETAATWTRRSWRPHHG